MNKGAHVLNLLRVIGVAMSTRPAARTVDRLLVIGYGAIGDTIFFIPILEAVRRAYPKARLVWVSNPSPVSNELIPATGLVDEVWKWEAQVEDPAGRAAVNARISAANFDLALLTMGAPAHDFLPSLSGIPVVVGHRLPDQGLKRFVVLGEYARRAVVNRSVPTMLNEHVLSRNLRLLDELEIPRPGPAPRPALPVPDAARRRAAELLEGLPGPVTALHLGPLGNQYHKMWAPARFAELTGRLEAKGSLILVGSPDEREAERLFYAAGGKSARSLIGQTSLLETFAVLESCARLISNDTGMAKAAAALGVPTVTIWGPSDPGEVGSPWEREKHRDIRTGISCSPCARLSSFTPGTLNYTNCGHHDCLGKLEVEAVRGVLDK